MAAPIRHLDVCAGLGGFSLGLRLANPRVRTVGYVEREAFAASLLLARMEDETMERAPVWCGDLREMDGRQLRGEVDILTAGFPCQPWSGAGKRLGTEDERWIWPDIAELIADVAPSCVVLENVSLDAFRQPFDDLRDLGFELPPPVEIAAEDVGAPHLRVRYFALGLSGRNGEVDACGAGEPVGDSHCEGLAVGEGGTGIRSIQPATGPAGAPGIWPPSRGDDDGWRDWLAAAGPEPAIRRDADGLPPRLVGPMRADRLRALGNAVLPQCVAAAWTYFARSL